MKNQTFIQIYFLKGIKITAGSEIKSRVTIVEESAGFFARILWSLDFFARKIDMQVGIELYFTTFLTWKPPNDSWILQECELNSDKKAADFNYVLAIVI